MIQAVKLSGTAGCGSHGWYACAQCLRMNILSIKAVRRSRVNQKGWEEVCGAAHRRVRKEPVSIDDLQSNLEDVREKSRDILKVFDVQQYGLGRIKFGYLFHYVRSDC